MKKLYLSDKDRKLAGVCGGLSEYFSIDSTIFRIAFILLTLVGGFGIVAYIVMWLVVPKKPGKE